MTSAGHGSAGIGAGTRKAEEDSRSASGRSYKATWRLVGLAVLGQMLRSRRFYEKVALAAVVLAALSGLGQESRARAFGRLVAWNKGQIQLLERKAEREAGLLERKAQRQAKRLAGKARNTQS